MKSIALVLVTVLLTAGCVTAKYNHETKEVFYQRLGDQKMQGVIVQTYPDGRIDILLESQQSEARLFQDALTLGMKIAEMNK